MRIFEITTCLLLLFAAVTNGYTQASDSTCYEDFKTIYDNYISKGSTEATLLYNLTIDLCYSYVSSIPTGMKPTVCAVSAVFSLPYMASIASDELDDYAYDYCDFIETQISNKVSALLNISNLDSSSDDYETKCQYYLANVTNKWFDPSIPYDTITYSDICSSLSDLNAILDAKTMTTTNDYVIYGYILFLQMYLTAMQEYTYQTCVDQRMQLDDTDSTYCTNLLTNVDFSLWSTDNEQSSCSTAQTAMQAKCLAAEEDLSYTCYPCAYTIAYIFSKYQSYLTQALENLYSSISWRATNILYTDNFDVTGDLYANSTLNLQYPEDVILV